MLIPENRCYGGLMCQVCNQVPGGFCSLFRRVGCGMLGKGKRHLGSRVFMLFNATHEVLHVILHYMLHEVNTLLKSDLERLMCL